MTLLILYAVLAIVISFLCSLMEACLLSIPRSYIETLVEKGSSAGAILAGMKDNIDRPLAAILTLNTIAHTVGAVGVGAQAAVVFGSAAVGVASAVMTLLVLVVSEIIPKTLGAVYAKRLAVPAALIIRLMILIGIPLIVPLERINRLIGYRRGQERLSRTELLSTIRLGQASGALQQREYRVVSNLMALSDIRLEEVLTPRTVVFSLPREMTVEQAWNEHYPIRFARIPVYAGKAEEVTGYVPRFAIHQAQAEGRGDSTLEQISEPILVFPEMATVGQALEKMMEQKRHIALVVDEYGGMSGIVSLEDLLESLLGQEIVDETDTIADMQELARRRFRQRPGK